MSMEDQIERLDRALGPSKDPVWFDVQEYVKQSMWITVAGYTSRTHAIRVARGKQTRDRRAGQPGVYRVAGLDRHGLIVATYEVQA